MLESVFIFSLAIMFILVGLLLYHIRGRLNASEQRIDTLYEMTNKLSNEINATRVFVANLRYIGSGAGSYENHAAAGGAGAAETIVPFQPSPSISVKKIVVSDNEDEGSDDDASDDDSDSDESESESALDDGEYVSEIHDDENEPDVDIDITEISSEPSREIPEEIEPVVSIEIVPDSEFEDAVAADADAPTAAHEDYSKMNLPALKKLATERELASAHDISKMKKTEIIALLSGAAASTESA